MPTGIPTKYEPPSDGLHVLTILSVETKKDGYGNPQEVAECQVDGEESNKTARLYFPHGSPKWFEAGVNAKVIEILPDGVSWRVVPGASCRALWTKGKITQIFAM